MHSYDIYAFLLYAIYPLYAAFLRCTILCFLPVTHFMFYVLRFLPTAIIYPGVSKIYL